DPAMAASMLFMALLAAWNARDHDRRRDITAKLAGLPVAADSDAAGVVRAGAGLSRLAAGEPLLGITPLPELVPAARDPKSSYDQHVRITAQKWEIMVGDIAAAYQHETESLQRFRGNGAIGHALSSMTNLARLELLRGMPRQARA